MTSLLALPFSSMWWLLIFKERKGKKLQAVLWSPPFAGTDHACCWRSFIAGCAWNLPLWAVRGSLWTWQLVSSPVDQQRGSLLGGLTARVLQVWWKVAAHFEENLWLFFRELMMQSPSLALNVRAPHAKQNKIKVKKIKRK